MMKNIVFLNKFLITALLVLLVFQSCTDLDEELHSQILVEDFFQTEEEFTAALASAYTGLYVFINNTWTINEISSDEMAVPQRGQDWADGGNWVRLHQHTYTPSDNGSTGAWPDIYGPIATCNRLISQFTDLGNESSVASISELKVLRALLYWWIMDLYGKAPIVVDFEGAEENPASNSRQEIYDFVISDILANIDNLSKQADVSTYARIQYYAAQTLLAKIYINAEVYTGTPEWQKVVDACDAVINSGEYALEADFFANFATVNDFSKENIYVIPYEDVFAPGFTLGQRTLHYGSRNTYQLAQDPWNGYCALEEFYNSFEDGDLRKGSFITGPQFHADGVTPVNDPSYEVGEDPDGEQLNFTPEINQLFPGALRQAGARVGKFEFAAGTAVDLSNDFPIFRYADVLLMKAEALWRLDNGSTEALELVNIVRARSSDATQANPLAPLTSLSADDLLAERGREMFAEGHRRQDLIRFDRFNDAWWEKPASDKTKNVFPVPSAQLDANPNLEQNEGYN